MTLNGQSWCTPGLGIRSIIFSCFNIINDLTGNFQCDVKLFADDTSLFTVVENETVSAQNMNRDLEKISLWAWQWKMHFNADKTEELHFSIKRLCPVHPSLRLRKEEIKSKKEHKHLGMIHDSYLRKTKLSC